MGYLVQLQIRSLAYFIYMGLQAEFGIENCIQVTYLLGGHECLPIGIDAKLGDLTGFDISGSNVSVLSALSFSKFDVIQEWIMARYLSTLDTPVLSSK